MAKAASPAVEVFKKHSAVISSKVVEVKDMAEAVAYALDVCEKKDFCETLPVGDGESAPDGRATVKTIAAPGLDEAHFAELEKQGKAKGFTVIRKGMREYLAGIDVGFSVVEKGIAETGSCIMAAKSEDERLASMVCEVHVVALPKSGIVRNLYDAEDYLNKVMAGGRMYTSFISGPSRTADIERVLTLGVHGPLELHVALLEG